MIKAPPSVTIRAGIREQAKEIGHMANLGRSIATNTRESEAQSAGASRSLSDLARVSSTRRALSPNPSMFQQASVVVDNSLREAVADVASSGPLGPAARQQIAALQQIATLPGGSSGARAGRQPGGMPLSGGTPWQPWGPAAPLPLGPGGPSPMPPGPPAPPGPLGPMGIPPGQPGLPPSSVMPPQAGPFWGVARGIGSAALQIGTAALRLAQIATGTIVADIVGTVVRAPDVAQNIEYAILQKAAQAGIIGDAQVEIGPKNSSDPFEASFLGTYKENKGIASVRATVNQVRRAYFLTGQEIEALWRAMGEQSLHSRHTLAGGRIMRQLGLSTDQAGSFLKATNAYVGPPPVSRRTRRQQTALSVASTLAPQFGSSFALRTAARWLPWSKTAGRPVTLETSMAYAQARGRPAEYLEDVTTYAESLGGRSGARIDERLALGTAALMNRPVSVRGVTTMLGGAAGRGIGTAAIEGAASTPDNATLSEKMRAVRHFLPSLTIGEKDSAITYDARQSPRDARAIVESGDPRTWSAYARQARADAKRLGLSGDWARAKFGDLMGGQLTVPQIDALWARTGMAANVLALEDTPDDSSTDWRSGPYFKKGADGSMGLGRTRAMADSAQHSLGRVFLKMANDIKDAAVIAASAFDGGIFDLAGTTMLQALRSVDPDTVNKLGWLALASGNPQMGTALMAGGSALPLGQVAQPLGSAVQGATPQVPDGYNEAENPPDGDYDEATDRRRGGAQPGEHTAGVADKRVIDFVRARKIENGADPDVEVTELDVSAYEEEIKKAGLQIEWQDAPPPPDTPPELSLDYQAPSRGKVFSGHGLRLAGMHHGLDFAGEVGSHVGAVAEGRVSFIQPREQWEKSKPGSGAFRAGAYVEVTHPDGRISRYLHLDQVEPDLKVGSPVVRGDRLGSLGSTGILHDKPHLHFELRQPPPRGERYGDSIDPKEIIPGL